MISRFLAIVIAMTLASGAATAETTKEKQINILFGTPEFPEGAREMTEEERLGTKGAFIPRPRLSSPRNIIDRGKDAFNRGKDKIADKTRPHRAVGKALVKGGYYYGRQNAADTVRTRRLGIRLPKRTAPALNTQHREDAIVGGSTVIGGGAGTAVGLAATGLNPYGGVAGATAGGLGGLGYGIHTNQQVDKAMAADRHLRLEFGDLGQPFNLIPRVNARED